MITQRPDPDHPSWALREIAARRSRTARAAVELEALSGDAERELLHALVGADTLPAELEALLLDRAEGNPFFLEELVRSLADAGALHHDEVRWRSTTRSPSRFRRRSRR